MPLPLDPSLQAPVPDTAQPSVSGLPAPMPFIVPAQLEFLEKKGLVSPQATLIAKARMGLADAQMGINPAQGFSRMMGPQGLPGAPVPQAMQSPPKAPSQASKQTKLSPEEDKAANAWLGLANATTWANPRELPVGTSINGLGAHKLPKAAYDLLQTMFPAKVKAGQVPMGWDAKTLDKMPLEQKSVLAQLIQQEQKASEVKALADPALQQKVLDAQRAVQMQRQLLQMQNQPAQPMLPPQPGQMPNASGR